MIYLASDHERCLSLVPNAANINIAANCGEALVDGGVIVDGVLRQAYDTTKMGKYCSEFIQTIGRWHGKQFHDFSNLVASQDCAADPGHAGTTTQQIEQPHWIVDNKSGAIINRESRACVQVGGDLEVQYYLSKRNSFKSMRSLRLPAYLFPCDRSCNPTLMQWVLEPASSIHNKTAEADASYRIRLRDHPSLCLRSGIDVATTYTWYERPEPLICGS